MTNGHFAYSKNWQMASTNTSPIREELRYIGINILFLLWREIWRNLGWRSNRADWTTQTEASVRSVWTARFGWVDRIFLDWPPLSLSTKSPIGGKMGGYDVQTGRSLCPVPVPADKVTASADLARDRNATSISTLRRPDLKVNARWRQQMTWDEPSMTWDEHCSVNFSLLIILIPTFTSQYVW
jgi:hypothetical protein